MTIITPPSYPNLDCPFFFDGATFRLSMRFIRGLQYATIRNDVGEVVVGSIRCADRQWLIPFNKLAGRGNLRFEDENGQYPDYRNFGGSCRLVYYTADEISRGVG